MNTVYAATTVSPVTIVERTTTLTAVGQLSADQSPGWGVISPDFKEIGPVINTVSPPAPAAAVGWFTTFGYASEEEAYENWSNWSN
jgi:hypothetical protein